MSYLQLDLNAVVVVAEGAVEDFGELGSRLLDGHFSGSLFGHVDVYI